MRPDPSTAERLLTRHYQVVLECRVRIYEIGHLPVDVRNVNALYSLHGHQGLPSAEDLNDQKLLQESLLAMPQALDGWLRSIVWIELEELGIESQNTNGESFILPALNNLPPNPRDRFGEAIHNGTFYEEAFEFHASFKARLRLMAIGNVSTSSTATCRVSTERTRRYSVVLNYEVTIDDYTAADIEACYVQHCRKWAEKYPERGSLILRAIPSTEEIEDQRALKRYLLDDPEILDVWLRNMLIIDLGYEDVVEVGRELDVEGQSLMPVIESLPPRARHRFREAVSRGRLLTTAEEFWDSFDLQIRSIDVQDIGT